MAATASSVLRLALAQLQGSDVVTAIRDAAGDEQMADAASRALAEYCGYAQLDRAAEHIRRWQQVTGEHNIRRILGRAADHAGRGSHNA